MRQDEEMAEFEGVEAVNATSMALLCEIDGEEHWIPRSQIAEASEVQQDGDEGTLVISQWLAEQKKLV